MIQLCLGLFYTLVKISFRKLRPDNEKSTQNQYCKNQQVGEKIFDKSRECKFSLKHRGSFTLS